MGTALLKHKDPYDRCFLAFRRPGARGRGVHLGHKPHVAHMQSIERSKREQYSPITGGNFGGYPARCVRYAIVGFPHFGCGWVQPPEKYSEVLAAKLVPKMQPISLGMFLGPSGRGSREHEEETLVPTVEPLFVPSLSYMTCPDFVQYVPSPLANLFLFKLWLDAWCPLCHQPKPIKSGGRAGGQIQFTL